MKVELFVTADSSLAVPIPSALAEKIGAAPGKSADVVLRDGSLIITLTPRRRRYTIEELLEGVTPDRVPDEVDWGPPRDGEMW